VHLLLSESSCTHRRTRQQIAIQSLITASNRHCSRSDIRFVERHKDTLITKWTAGMDHNRHQADSEHKYSMYFDLLESKISEHSVLPDNSYNMDEKGFMIGRTGRSKRVFSRALWESKQVTDSLQDGNRE
jgi:hypothetical protein